MGTESIVDSILLIIFWVLFLGVPWILIKTNKWLKDAWDGKKPFGCCCLLLMLFVWFCILAVVAAFVWPIFLAAKR